MVSDQFMRNKLFSSGNGKAEFLQKVISKHGKAPYIPVIIEALNKGAIADTPLLRQSLSIPEGESTIAYLTGDHTPKPLEQPIVQTVSQTITATTTKEIPEPQWQAYGKQPTCTASSNSIQITKEPQPHAGNQVSKIYPFTIEQEQQTTNQPICLPSEEPQPHAGNKVSKIYPFTIEQEQQDYFSLIATSKTKAQDNSKALQLTAQQPEQQTEQQTTNQPICLPSEEPQPHAGNKVSKIYPFTIEQEQQDYFSLIATSNTKAQDNSKALQLAAQQTEQQTEQQTTNQPICLPSEEPQPHAGNKVSKIYPFTIEQEQQDYFSLIATSNTKAQDNSKALQLTAQQPEQQTTNQPICLPSEEPQPHAGNQVSKRYPFTIEQEKQDYFSLIATSKTKAQDNSKALQLAAQQPEQQTTNQPICLPSEEPQPHAGNKVSKIYPFTIEQEQQDYFSLIATSKTKAQDNSKALQLAAQQPEQQTTNQPICLPSEEPQPHAGNKVSKIYPFTIEQEQQDYFSLIATSKTKAQDNSKALQLAAQQPEQQTTNQPICLPSEEPQPHAGNKVSKIYPFTIEQEQQDYFSLIATSKTKAQDNSKALQLAAQQPEQQTTNQPICLPSEEPQPHAGNKVSKIYPFTIEQEKQDYFSLIATSKTKAQDNSKAVQLTAQQTEQQTTNQPICLPSEEPQPHAGNKVSKIYPFTIEQEKQDYFSLIATSKTKAQDNSKAVQLTAQQTEQQTTNQPICLPSEEPQPHAGNQVSKRYPFTIEQEQQDYFSLIATSNTKAQDNSKALQLTAQQTEQQTEQQTTTNQPICLPSEEPQPHAGNQVSKIYPFTIEQEQQDYFSLIATSNTKAQDNSKALQLTAQQTEQQTEQQTTNQPICLPSEEPQPHAGNKVSKIYPFTIEQEQQDYFSLIATSNTKAQDNSKAVQLAAQQTEQQPIVLTQNWNGSETNLATAYYTQKNITVGIIHAPELTNNFSIQPWNGSTTSFNMPVKVGNSDWHSLQSPRLFNFSQTSETNFDAQPWNGSTPISNTPVEAGNSDWFLETSETNFDAQPWNVSTLISNTPVEAGNSDWFLETSETNFDAQPWNVSTLISNTPVEAGNSDWFLETSETNFDAQPWNGSTPANYTTMVSEHNGWDASLRLYLFSSQPSHSTGAVAAHFDNAPKPSYGLEKMWSITKSIHDIYKWLSEKPANNEVNIWQLSPLLSTMAAFLYHEKSLHNFIENSVFNKKIIMLVSMPLVINQLTSNHNKLSLPFTALPGLGFMAANSDFLGPTLYEMLMISSFLSYGWQSFQGTNFLFKNLVLKPISKAIELSTYYQENTAGLLTYCQEKATEFFTEKHEFFTAPSPQTALLAASAIAGGTAGFYRGAQPIANLKDYLKDEFASPVGNIAMHLIGLDKNINYWDGFKQLSREMFLPGQDSPEGLELGMGLFNNIPSLEKYFPVVAATIGAGLGVASAHLASKTYNSYVNISEELHEESGVVIDSL